ncbi:PREDICTED: U7 snRNA-associated Sm-like protein LSm11 [Colobus angolensis palliatus]|uniref:U7 snRNA-associated Sm-like protein LSm11 n=1 Tax=Colobus angolensis palliatus TaxID=336983 RepID=UPI0005F530EC|nr:PREDICTED: U7 snRNA-associated Sm-like protein LSm11 [Colobus angolensis palliatus]
MGEEQQRAAGIITCSQTWPLKGEGSGNSGAAAVRKLAAEGASAGRRCPGAGLHVLWERLGGDLRGSSATVGWNCLSNVGNDGVGRVPLMHEGSPLGELHRCIREGVKVNVHIRTFKGLRGVCTGFLVAFDKFWNMALTDVDETYRKPVLGKAYERDSSLTLTRLFDRLKLQDSSKKEADSKSAVEDSTLSRYSQTSTWKLASVWGRGDTDRGSHKRSRSVPSSLQASAREESRSELSGRTTRTEGSSVGGTVSRATTLSRGQSRKKKRKPKVDYQQVFTRHINQIFIRGENVLLVHLAQ